MASKLDKLRQWAGEVISSKEKSPVNEELRELEKDIELRKQGLNKLLGASEAYHHALSKKKETDVLEESDKLLPIDSLGVVMISHGEDFGQESPFGLALMKFGRAHCRVATLQEAYALTFKDTFITSISKFKDEIKEAAYESAWAKNEKIQTAGNKREKDRREAEDEMERARQRYEETAEDMRAHMHAIQENEFGQLRDLGAFLDLEMGFIQSYLDILKDVKSDWVHNTSRSTTHRTHSRRGSQVIAARSKPPSARSAPVPAPRQYTDSSDDESPSHAPLSSSPSKSHRRGSSSSRPPSRPGSRLSRKRANSNATSVGGGQEEKGSLPNGTEKTEKHSRRLSMAGWASSAVESVTGGKKKKAGKEIKDKDADGDDESAPISPELDGTAAPPPAISKSSSFRAALSRKMSTRDKAKESLPSISTSVTNGGSLSSPASAAASPSRSAPSKILKPPSMQDRKVVRALYDFSGSSDELSFKSGAEIVVVNEVLEEWWMGELDGKKGLFPTSYTEVVKSKSPKAVNGASSSNGSSSGGFLRVQKEKEEYVTSDDDRDLRREPMAISSPLYSGFKGVDTLSLSDSMAESEDERRVGGLRSQPPTRDEDEEYWFGPPVSKPTPPSRPTTPKKKKSDPLEQPLLLQEDHEDHDHEHDFNSAHALQMGTAVDDSDTSSLKASNAKPGLDRGGSFGSAHSQSSGSVITPGSSVSNYSSNQNYGATPKRVPPPPPPRRLPTTTPNPGPPIPLRRLPPPPTTNVSASVGANGLTSFPAPLVPPPSGMSSRTMSSSSSAASGGYDKSPFDSAVELDLVPVSAPTTTTTTTDSKRLNPFHTGSGNS